MTLIKPVAAVNGIIMNSKNQVLLTRRSAIVREPGKWCLPGGHLDGGEDWISALRRELHEEIGITVLKEKLIGIYSDPKLTVTERPNQDGLLLQFLVASFLVQEYQGEISKSDEVDLWGWFLADSLPEPILKSHPVRVQDACNFQTEVFVR